MTTTPYWSTRGIVIVAFVVSTLNVIAHASGSTVPPVPTISGPITGPALMYPNPPISVVPGAISVESFPYITEE